MFGPQKEDSLILRNYIDIWFQTAVKFLTVIFFMFGAHQPWHAGTGRLLKTKKKCENKLEFLLYIVLYVPNSSRSLQKISNYCRRFLWLPEKSRSSWVLTIRIERGEVRTEKNEGRHSPSNVLSNLG